MNVKQNSKTSMWNNKTIDIVFDRKKEKKQLNMTIY